jgi:hypothetical protein
MRRVRIGGDDGEDGVRCRRMDHEELAGATDQGRLLWGRADADDASGGGWTVLSSLMMARWAGVRGTKPTNKVGDSGWVGYSYRETEQKKYGTNTTMPSSSRD